MQKNEMGFLCKSIQLAGKNFNLYEKEKGAYNYNEILNTYRGYTHGTRIGSKIIDSPLNYCLETECFPREHIRFVVACIGFLFGVKLVSEPHSYIGNTCITPHSLGFIAFDDKKYVELIDKILTTRYNDIQSSTHKQYASAIEKTKIIENAIFLLFLSDLNSCMNYEEFFRLYSAIDCCFKYYCQAKVPALDMLYILSYIARINPCEYSTVLNMAVNIRHAMMHNGLFQGTLYAHRPDIKLKKEYQPVRIFLKSLLIRIIFNMLKFDVKFTCKPDTLDQESLHFV